MNKEKICIDLDDTIWEFHKHFFDFYNKLKRTKVNYKSYNIYSLKSFFGISKEEEDKLFEMYESTTNFFEPVFLKGFLESLNFLKENYEIHFVTARHEGIKEKTEKILKKYFNFEFQVFFTRNFEHEEIKSKAKYCEEEGIHLIIEDKLETVKECVFQGMNAILIDRPWNQEKKLNEKIIRVKNWEEILKILKNGN